MTGEPSAGAASRPALQVWRGFAVVGLVLAILAGFTSGSLAQLANAASLAAIWPAALAQAHGHVQVYGFAGLITLGVAQHFVPRLRGVSPPAPGICRLGLLLLGAGLALRILSQPLLAGLAESTAPFPAAAGLIASGLLELAGAGLLLSTLAATLRRPAVERKRPSRTVSAALLVGSTAYGAGLLLNLAGVWSAATDDLLRGLIPGPVGAAATVIGFYGFLLPIAFAMGSRTFPLFFRAQAPRSAVLAAALGLVTSGTTLRVTGLLAPTSGLRVAGEVLLACGVLAGILALQVFTRRRTLSRERRSAWLDPLNLLVTSAHGWLALAALVLLGRNLAPPGASLVPRSLDVEWHLLGAGYVTLLILAVGSHLLPGFGGQRLRWPWASWALLILGNSFVVGRLASGLFPGSAPARWLASGAGPLAMAALLLFALNCGLVGIARRSGPRAGALEPDGGRPGRARSR